MGLDGEKERQSAEVIRSDTSVPAPVLPTVNPAIEKPESPSAAFHPSFYVVAWIVMSSSIILFNKWILDTAKFHYPIILTCWHLTFGTAMTQILSRTTNLLDGRKKVKMTGRIYLRAIVPIGLFFSLSLICGNLTYLYLSVAFIQMLKATMPVAVLITTWVFGVAKPDLKVFFNVSFIVIGVVIASFGEIQFVLTGFLYQLGGIVFEAVRLVMIQRLLSSDEYKMDPLVSFYYFAPVCAVMNFFVACVFELPYVSAQDFYNVGLFTLLLNAIVAFGLNVCLVFLIGKTSSLVLTLCGVLKDVLLVGASIAIWGTPVTGLQFFGYAIALGGMVYYKLGMEQIKGHISDLGRRWAEYGSKRPAQRKILVFVFIVVSLFLLLGGLAPSVGYDTTAYANEGKDYVSKLLGGKGTLTSGT